MVNKLKSSTTKKKSNIITDYEVYFKDWQGRFRDQLEETKKRERLRDERMETEIKE